MRKCPYCDFNSFKATGALPEAAYVDALLRDFASEAKNICGREIQSIYIGGGTPSLFRPESIERLLDGIARACSLRTDLEISLEANPGAIELERFAGFREAGVNRVSIGVQSFRDQQLRSLGRVHDAEAARRAVAAALNSNFRSVNVDLMYGLPGDDRESALLDLDELLAMQPQHFSWYQLTLEPNTAFYRRPPSNLPAEPALLAIEAEGRARISSSGFVRYEVSAYTRGQSECAHNLNYWMFGDYIGIGAGAHGKHTEAEQGVVKRSSKLRNPRSFMNFAGRDENVAIEIVEAPDSLTLEYLMGSLRLMGGMRLDNFEARTGLNATVLRPRLAVAQARGWIRLHGSEVHPTELGMQQLNAFLMLFC